MLRYDAAWLIEQYRDEPLAAPGIPYAPLGGAGPYRVVPEAKPYRLTPSLDIRPQLAYAKAWCASPATIREPCGCSPAPSATA